MARSIEQERIGRRTTLAFFGGAAAALAGCRSAQDAQEPHSGPPERANVPAAPRCIVTPRETAGPYFRDERLERSDIRIDPVDGAVSRGIPLHLALSVHSIRGDACAPLAGAAVDIWHCNAVGVYSDVEEARGKKFLRGYQKTDTEGRVQFVTIYPGWYEGRTVHIHFKVRTFDSPRATVSEFISQLYFDDAVTDRVLSDPRYAHRGVRLKNEDDSLFLESGRELVLDTAVAPGGDYTASFSVGIRTV